MRRLKWRKLPLMQQVSFTESFFSLVKLTTATAALALFTDDDDLASFSNRIDVKQFVDMMGVVSVWSARMLGRFAELRTEVENLRSELKDELARRKTADMDRDGEHQRRVELEATLAVAEQKLTKVSAALGIVPE